MLSKSAKSGRFIAPRPHAMHVLCEHAQDGPHRVAFICRFCACAPEARRAILLVRRDEAPIGLLAGPRKSTARMQRSPASCVVRSCHSQLWHTSMQASRSAKHIATALRRRIRPVTEDARGSDAGASAISRELEPVKQPNDN